MGMNLMVISWNRCRLSPIIRLGRASRGEWPHCQPGRSEGQLKLRPTGPGSSWTPSRKEPGTPGGDYSHALAGPAAGMAVSVPDFARGPGQPVDVPATGAS